MNTSRKLTAFFLALLCMATLFFACGDSGSDYEQIKENGTLMIGITYYKPMNYFEDDTLVGFDTEFAKVVCEKLGITAQFTLIDWETKENSLKSGNIDCIWNGLTVTEERKSNMAFSTAYLINKQCIVINKADEATFTDTAALSSAILTAEKGSAGESAIAADANLSKATYTGSSSQQDAFLAVKTGNAQAAVVDYTMAKSICGTGDYADLVCLDIELTNEEYAIGFRLGSDMVEKVNTIIDELIADGTLATIAAKYELTELYEEAVK